MACELGSLGLSRLHRQGVDPSEEIAEFIGHLQRSSVAGRQQVMEDEGGWHSHVICILPLSYREPFPDTFRKPYAEL